MLGRLDSRFQGYNLGQFQKDLLSGLIVGVVAIPLGMAFAIASGVRPEYGLYTTIIAGILISLLGGSKFNIGGPTGAFIPILFAIVAQYGYENLLIAGMMAGGILVLMGLLRLGSLVKYISRPITVGFTTGIAVIIFTGQIANFLGLRDIKKHEEFILNMKELAIHLDTFNIYAIITAVICFVTIQLARKFLPKVPGPILGLVLSTVVAVLFYPNEVATIGSTFGAIPNTLPSLHFPEISFDTIQNLIGPALAIALLGGIESLLCAVVADGMTGYRHNSNKELVGQGIANIITPLFGGIPATGAIARTATNIKNGAQSPFSGIIMGLVVFLIMLLFAPYASLIPLASMAPILMVVAYNMSEYKEFIHVLKTKTSDSAVLVITFLLTVFMDLVVAVEVSLVLSIALFLKGMTDNLKVSKVLPDPNDEKAKVIPERVHNGTNCPQISMYSVEGPLYFGAASEFEVQVLDSLSSDPNVLILRMGKVSFMDTTGEYNLAKIVKHLHKQGTSVLISGIKEQPLKILKKTGLYEEVGPENFFARTGEALNFALTQLDENKCRGCEQFAFRECIKLSYPAKAPTPIVEKKKEAGEKEKELVLV
ncbi:MAG: SulP family inorganic anion transporter [Bacillota bacterium]